MKRNLFVGIAVAALLGVQVNAQTCTQQHPVTMKGQALNMSDGDTFSINGDQLAQPGGTDVLVFDIYNLDNSFNIMFGSTQLASKELQFDKSAENVAFANGDQYGIGSIPDIWTLDGTAVTPNEPIVRLTIDNNGAVQLAGATSNGGALQALHLTDNTTFSTVSFSSAQSNPITITQTVMGPTGINAVSYWTTKSCVTLGTNEVNFKGFAYNSIVKGQLQLKSSNAIQDVKIYNMTGQLVRTAQPNTGNANINLQELQPGVYVMNVTINGSTKAYKVVKQ